MCTKNDKWFDSIKWDSACLKCQSVNGDICPSRSCAEDNYDQWGDHIPSDVYYMDGNNLQEYLAEKRKRKMEE